MVSSFYIFYLKRYLDIFPIEQFFYFLGYNLYDDTKEIPKGEVAVVDRHFYHGDVNPDGCEPILKNGKMIKQNGYLPRGIRQQNSEYMADFADVTVNQIKKWVDQKVLINIKHCPEYDESLGAFRAELKLTIEPSKPRLWYFYFYIFLDYTKKISPN